MVQMRRYSNPPLRLPPLFPFYKTPARYQPLPAPGAAFNIATLVVKGPTDDMAHGAALILIVIKRFSWKREAILVFDVVLDTGGGSWVFYILAAVFADSHRFFNRNSCHHLQRCFVPKKSITVLCCGSRKTPRRWDTCRITGSVVSC